MMATRRWLFVTGASRSGTTLLCRALGRHSQILGMNELHYFGDIFSPAEGTTPLPQENALQRGASLIARQRAGIWHDTVEAADQRRALQILERIPAGSLNGFTLFGTIASQLAADQGRQIACEQTPRNIYYARAILDHLPAAQIIHMVRDPRAVLASQKNRWKRRAHSNKHIPFSEMVRVWANYHPFTMIKLWVKATEMAESLAQEPRVTLVRYEDLVQQPAQQLAGILTPLGLDLEPAMLEIDVVGSSQRQDVGGKGFSRDSVDSWRNVLNPAEIWITERIAAAQMKRHGYWPASVRPPPLSLLASALRYPLHTLAVVATNPRRAMIQLKGLLGGR